MIDVVVRKVNIIKYNWKFIERGVRFVLVCVGGLGLG